MVNKNCKFHHPQGKVLELGCCHIRHKVKMHYFCKNLHKNDDQGSMILLSYAIVDFNLSYDGAVDMQI